MSEEIKKRSKKPTEMGKVKVGVKEHHGFILREHLGEGEWQGKKFQISNAIPGRDLVVELDGRYFVVPTYDLTGAVLALVSP